MVEFTFDTKGMQRWVDGCEAALTQATAAALNRTAFKARTEITRQLPGIFSSVTPATARSILYTKADPAHGLDRMSASVFVKFDPTGGSNPPERWLRAEIDGGPRRDKRSEVLLKAAGIMGAGQQQVPGSGAGGPLSGARMVQVLSQVRAFGEQGFRANASEATRRRLKKLGVPVVRKTGLQFFVAREKRSGAPMAIYQVMGRGRVAPVLWFVDKRPSYRMKLPFTKLAEAVFARTFPEAMRDAVRMAVRAGGSTPR